MGWVADRLAEKRRFTPQSGCNLVAVDPGPPDEDALYLIGHYETEEQAQAELERLQPGDAMTRFFVYGAETKRAHAVGADR